MDELLSQIPPGIIAYGLMIPLLMIGLIVYVTVIRPALAKRKKAKEVGNSSLTTPTPSALTTPMPTTQNVSTLDDDMPDIDRLLAQAEQPTTSVIFPQPVSSQPPTRPAGPRQLGEAEVALITGQTIHAREELILLRDPVDGRLIVQMPGVTYKSFMSAPAAKEQFTRLMNELAKSLGQPDGIPAPTAPTISPVIPVPVPTPESESSLPVESALVSDSQSTSEQLVTPEIPDGATPPLPPLQPYTPPPTLNRPQDGALPGDLPRYTNMRGAELKGRGFLGRPKFEFERIPDLNLAESIEAYLQYRLAQTPGYGGRPWHVHPSPDGGVRIEVDGKVFEAVSDISDPAARTFIQAAIQEWQDRQ